MYCLPCNSWYQLLHALVSSGSVGVTLDWTLLCLGLMTRVSARGLHITSYEYEKLVWNKLHPS